MLEGFHTMFLAHGVDTLLQLRVPQQRDGPAQHRRLCLLSTRARNAHSHAVRRRDVGRTGQEGRRPHGPRQAGRFRGQLRAKDSHVAEQEVWLRLRDEELELVAVVGNALGQLVEDELQRRKAGGRVPVMEFLIIRAVFVRARVEAQRVHALDLVGNRAEENLVAARLQLQESIDYRVQAPPSPVMS